MFVKIVKKCKTETTWYNDHIGEIFEVEDIKNDNGIYTLLKSHHPLAYGIYREDCRKLTRIEELKMRIGYEI